jgi:hypothetical protein
MSPDVPTSDRRPIKVYRRVRLMEAIRRTEIFLIEECRSTLVATLRSNCFSKWTAIAGFWRIYWEIIRLLDGEV